MHAHSCYFMVRKDRGVVLAVSACGPMSLGIVDTVVAQLENDAASRSVVETTIARFQSMLASSTPSGYSVIDKLISEREEVSFSE